MHLSPYWGQEDPIGVQWSLSVCMSFHMLVRLSFHLYLYLYFWLSASRFGNQSVRPVIARSACSQYIYRGGGGSYTKIKTIFATQLENNYVSVCLSIYPYVSPYIWISARSYASLFGDKIMWPIIVCSTCGAILQSGWGFVYTKTNKLFVTRSDNNYVSAYISICLSVHLPVCVSISMSGCLCHFGAIKSRDP